MATTNGVTSVKLGNRKHILAQIAEHKKRSVHSLVVEAVDAYIEHTQARIEYETQAMRSYENYQQTGLHVTHEELQVWANSLDSNEPIEAPPMSQVIYTDEAKRDLVRFANFLIENNAAKQAKIVTNLILECTRELANFPLMGASRFIDGIEFRELTIKYGKSGYVSLYSFDPLTDIVVIHAFRHQRELGYTLS